MEIQVKHGSTDITSRVVSYNREHNICTGIGRLQITLEGTYSTSISPHDTISIYENGDFKVKYYVSDVDRNAPDGTIVLQCQDRSKYLVDYFISESYSIDYPSYTRYWIQLFFDQAGINYEFTTDSQGNLLSNYTQLGLQPAYDQIMMLCQLSGWYFYFDGNGKAIIGSLTTDLSSGGSVGMDDILEIKKITDDKMLRNRAVVWGQYDTIRQEYAYADISKHTPWNYDHDDLRTMVISNNNIPNRSSAYSIANILLKEFAKVTVEKHLTVHGARDLNLGETLRVTSHVWKGKGLITTFGVTMDRNGLVTNIILDERCPRLFGFFDFGDYVYVATFGDGVWRKHIKFDPAWYNFSTGLTNLNITDLHINNGVFGSVGHSGNMYIADNEAGPWHEVTVTGLPSAAEDSPSGVVVEMETFSGIMARATIVDKLSNNVKFAVDTWSGLNTGDYFLTYSGLFATTSGIITTSGVSISGMRAWVLEYDPFTGQLVGGLGSGIYPIVYSGRYNMQVLDLENDGRNDYVSVADLGGTLILGDSTLPEYNYGSNPDYDGNAKVSLTTLEDNPSQLTALNTSTTQNYYGHNATDNVGEHNVLFLYFDSFVGSSRVRFFRYKANLTGFTTLSSQIFSLATLTANDKVNTSPIVRVSPNNYKMFVMSGTTLLSSVQLPLYKRHLEFTNPGMTETDSTFFVSPPDDMDFSAPPFPFELRVNVVPYFFNKFAILVWNWFYSFVGNSYYNKIWFQRFDYDSESLSPAQLVFEVQDYAGTNSDEAGVILAQYGESFQSVGLYTDRDATDPTKTYVLAGAGNSLSVGGFLFDGSSYSQKNIFKLSDSISARWLDPGDGFIYVNYGIHGIQTLNPASDPFTFDSQTFLSIWYVKELPTAAFCFDSDPTVTNYKLMKSSLSPFLGSWEEVSMPGYYPISLPAYRTDSVYGNIYVFIKSVVDGQEYLARMDASASTIISKIKVDVSRDFIRPTNVGNFFISEFSTGASTRGYWSTYLKNLYPDLGDGTNFLVLQRDNSDFNLIQSGAKPFRIDISNSSPVLTVQDFDGTFASNFVYGNELTRISAISGIAEVRDYRYALLETLSGTIVGSGYPVTSQLLYVYQSGVYTSDVNTYSGGFTLYNTIPSGNAERIETSNFTYPGQYIFVTTSGDNPMFYQKDNDGLFFDSYSGLPDSRATIIRVDDRF